jgi:hypothetical protein
MVRLSQIKTRLLNISDDDWVAFGFCAPLAGILWTFIIMGFLSADEAFLESHAWLKVVFGGLFLGLCGFAFASLLLLLLRTVFVELEADIK